MQKGMVVSMKIVAQLFGVGAMMFLFLINQQKERKKLIICKMMTDICWVGHYFCLSAVGGMIPNFVGIFRETVFMNRETKKWAAMPFWPIIFMCINWTLGFMTFSAPVNIIPIVASTLVTVSLWLKKTWHIKLLLCSASLLFLIYDLFVDSWIGVLSESISILSIIIYFIKTRRVRNEE
jgi:hypothetical protein